VRVITPGVAFRKSMSAMDESYISESEAADDVTSMCCGTCAVAACVELPDPSDKKQQVSVTVANLGDSRVVCGKFKNSSLFVEALSDDHSIESSVSERNRLKNQFPHVEEIMVLGDGDAEEHGTVMGLCRFTRSIGDCHMKTAKSADACAARAGAISDPRTRVPGLDDD
jgi:serine/threonine protein phosphatase PrpC